jgi:hypothetical protein
MTKIAVTRLFFGSLIAVAAGLVLGSIGVIAAFQGGAFVMDGPDVIGLESTAFTWSMVALVILSLLTVVGGFVGGMVSWIGALLNTAQLEDKFWFLFLLVLGLLSFGLLAMIVYVIVGPDGTRRPSSTTVPIAA